MVKRWGWAVLAVAFWAGTAAADDLVLYGAGSLKDAIGEAARSFAGKTGHTVTVAFGPSGLMRERIEKGEKVDVFTSADMGHPARLHDAGRAGPVVLFTRNALCAMALPEVGLTTANLVDKLLDPAVKIATSTPKADPGGDYTWMMFERVERVRPGAFKTLDAKAQQLVGNSTAPLAAGAPDPLVTAFQDGRVNTHIGYCTSARNRAKQIPGLTVAEMPAELRVGPDYGLTVLKGAAPAAADLALFIMSTEGQTILAQHGFLAVGLPGATP